MKMQDLIGYDRAGTADHSDADPLRSARRRFHQTDDGNRPRRCARWDSFNYINFIVAVEAEFGVKFRIADVESFPNVGAIVKTIGTARSR
jgi:acyl carrier protein